MLADFHHERGFVREIDLFIVGTVLQYLTLKKHIAAAVALQSYAHKVSPLTFLGNNLPLFVSTFNQARFLATKETTREKN